MPLQRSAEGTTRNINGREDLSCDPRQLQQPVAADLPPSVEQTEPASSRYITHTPTTYTHKMTARVRKRSMQQRVGRETVWQIEQYGWEGQRFPHSLFVKSNGMLTSYISSGMCPNQVYVHISLGRLLDISLLLPCLFLSCVFFIIACRSGCSLIFTSICPLPNAKKDKGCLQNQSIQSASLGPSMHVPVYVRQIFCGEHLSREGVYTAPLCTFIWSRKENRQRPKWTWSCEPVPGHSVRFLTACTVQFYTSHIVTV